ncbi:hypothetical protein SAMN05216464_102719 [Mucilaginibacter pineti]|uniref:MG2 domain-containing protein n=1 Tax=Mucilaginibacter pineti TaxID=1391627 RepID=A0A1G6Y195_9SPHI|nr:hypothetical protein [Mucilaginibacter pineti]SDD83396.1 hypothetical protein SAMN05216464_102719 [Mucilaginibacter pineti]
MTNKAKFCLALSVVIIISFKVFKSAAQTAPTGGIDNVLSAVANRQIAEAKESVYLQFDKPYYSAGDTIWYKAYVFDAASLGSTTKSGLLHINISNEKGEIVKNFVLPLIIGLGWGNIPLDEHLMPPGTYTIRAYTNWMRNYSDEPAFTQTFYINGKTDNAWLVKAVVAINGKKDSAALNLSFNNLNAEPVRVQSMRLRISSGGKYLAGGKVQTRVDGLLGISFPLPIKAIGKQVLLSITEDSKEITKQQIIMPLAVNRAANTDVQFMPEGGNLVEGINGNIGFKATGEDGSSVPVSGEIIDRSGAVITTFKTRFNGMGNFQFKPLPGETYTASINFPGGLKKSYPIPDVKPLGTVFNVVNPKDTVALLATINASSQGGIYYIIGQGRGLASYGAIIRLTGKDRTIKIPKNIFPTGIARISLLDQNRKLLNERLVYIDHQDRLKINVTTNKQTYGKRDSVALQFNVTDEANNPVKGSFSVAVTDNGQVKTDSISQGNIITRMLITAGVKGDIETPGHYLQQTPEAWADLDLLLYTQGWTAYDWDGLFTPAKEPKFKAETQFEVSGKVTNVFGKAVAGTRVSLFGPRPLIFKDTLTDAKGRFTFSNFPRIDTPIFNIRTVNKNGKAFNVGVEMDVTPPPVFAQTQRVLMPWNANSDTVMINSAVNKKLTDKEEMALLTNGGKMLNEVKIKGVKSVKGSHNLNPLNGAEQVLDENDMIKAGNMSLVKFLQTKINSLTYDPFRGFRIHNKRVHFIFDGINLEDGLYDTEQKKILAQLDQQFLLSENDSKIQQQNIYIESLIDAFTAEDIVGVEVMTSMKNSMLYNSKYNPGDPVDYVRGGPAYVEITTRGKRGPYNKVSIGMALFRGAPLAWPRQHFYSPKYFKKQNMATTTDRRSTIFWEPNLVTGPDGKATLSFYTSDIAGIYTIVMEGADMSGSIGTITQTLKVN